MATQAGGNTTTTAATTTVADKERGPPIAAPTAFDGNRKNTKKFIHECHLYFDGKPKDFQTQGQNDDKLKIAFVLSYMNKGLASNWAQRYMARPYPGPGETFEAKKHRTDTYSQFEDIIKKAFEEHQAGETARMQMDALKQGNFSVDAYTERFNDLAPDTGYEENALKHMYIKGLNREIENQIMLMEKIPEDLWSLQDKAATFYLRRRNYGYNQKGDTLKNYMGSGTSHDPVQVNQGYVRHSPEKLQELRNKRACFKCGRTGHIARFCQGTSNFQGQGQGQGGQPNYKRNNFKARAVTIEEFLEGASAEQLNEFSMAIKDAQPAESQSGF
jgi:hypothetical protein